MKTEYKVAPSGRLYLAGVEVQQDDRQPAYRAYVDWLREGNGPEEIEEIAPPDAPDPGEELGAIDAELTKLEERIARLRERTTTPKETR